MSDETLIPITREETYLAAIAGEDVTAPSPVIRPEQFLAAINDHVDGLEEDVSGVETAVTALQTQVPASTAEDAGKVLIAGSTAGTASWSEASADVSGLPVPTEIVDSTYSNVSSGVLTQHVVPRSTFLTDAPKFCAALANVQNLTAAEKDAWFRKHVRLFVNSIEQAQAVYSAGGAIAYSSMVYSAVPNSDHTSAIVAQNGMTVALEVFAQEASRPHLDLTPTLNIREGSPYISASNFQAHVQFYYYE